MWCPEDTYQGGVGPGLTEESQSLYKAYKKQYSSNHFAEGTLETGNKLIDTMKEEEMGRGNHID